MQAGRLRQRSPEGTGLNNKRLSIQIEGAVQGVGFRPFVYRLAIELALAGWVTNTARGVLIDVEGGAHRLRRFQRRLRAERPAHALVQRLTTAWREPVGYHDFVIRASDEAGEKSVVVLPELATCPECLTETLDPADRRYRYPFTNCTACGPRFSIIEALPYDRQHTTMRGFMLCPACAREYHDPLDRRFHAQPNACPACGPQLSFWAADEAGVLGERAAGYDALRRAAAALRQGKIAAVKGLGGYHLMVDASDAAAVARLRERKRRPRKPLAIMVASLADVRALCILPEDMAKLLTSPQAPIVLLSTLR